MKLLKRKNRKPGFGAGLDSVGGAIQALAVTVLTSATGDAELVHCTGMIESVNAGKLAYFRRNLANLPRLLHIRKTLGQRHVFCFFAHTKTLVAPKSFWRYASALERSVSEPK